MVVQPHRREALGEVVCALKYSRLDDDLARRIDEADLLLVAERARLRLVRLDFDLRQPFREHRVRPVVGDFGIGLRRDDDLARAVDEPGLAVFTDAVQPSEPFLLLAPAAKFAGGAAGAGGSDEAGRGHHAEQEERCHAGKRVHDE
jgi:hypothetical protein